MSHRIGVVIVNYNSGHWLADCLNAIGAQTVKPDRVMVVDNASADGSESAIDDVKLTGVELMRLEANTGFARANNLAVSALTDVDWIVTLNPDAIAGSTWLAALSDAIDRHPEYDFFGSKMLANSANTLDGVGDIYHTSGLVWRSRHGFPPNADDDLSREIFSPCAAAAMYRRTCWLEAGGLDERYFCYVEDVDLGFRLRLLGYRCRYLPDAEVTHAGSAVSGSHSDFTVYHGHRNLVWTYIKNMPAPLFWLYLPQHLLLNLVTIAAFVLRRQSAPVLRAKRDALLRVPEFWTARRSIQGGRRASAPEIRQALTRGFRPLWRRKYRYRRPSRQSS